MNHSPQDLEKIMKEMEAVDSASSDVSMGDDMDMDDFIPELDDIDETVPDVSSLIESEEESDVVTDYNSARNQLHWLINANQKMIVNNARLVKVTTHPKNFEMHQKMVESHIKLCSALVDLSPKVDEGKMKSRITRSNKIIPEPEKEPIEGEFTDDGKVSITRRPTQTALFEAVNANREIEKTTGKGLSNEQITELAFQIQKTHEESEEGTE